MALNKYTVLVVTDGDLGIYWAIVTLAKMLQEFVIIRADFLNMIYC